MLINKLNKQERTDAADESERSQNLLLRQQNLDDLVVGRGETLKTQNILKLLY